MKPVVKIIILCVLIFALSIFVAKKSIDYTFKEVECTKQLRLQTLHFQLTLEHLSHSFSYLFFLLLTTIILLIDFI